ncbi:DUF4347 domain-containing protein, partial [Pseudomonadota bacterium]
MFGLHQSSLLKNVSESFSVTSFFSNMMVLAICLLIPVTSVHAETLSQPDTDSVSINEIVLIDSGVKDHQALLHGLVGKNTTKVVYMPPNGKPIQKLIELSEKYRNISTLHIVSHGEKGALNLGDSLLDLSYLNKNIDSFNTVSDMFAPDGDILLYGCDVAGNKQGELFVSRLAELTKTDVAASNDKTGASSLSGDWELEYISGVVNAQVFYSPVHSQHEYAYVLPTFDFESGVSGGGTQTVAQTVSGITLTAVISGGAGNWLHADAGGLAGTSGNVIGHTASASSTHTFTFSSAVNLTSMQIGDQGSSQTLVFTPSPSGTTYNKDLLTGGESFVPADWSSLTSFTITLQGGGVFLDTLMDDIAFAFANSAPTLTSFASVLDTTNEDTEVELTLAEFQAQGDEADTEDGTVSKFVIKAVSTGTLKIGVNSGAATAYAATTNDTIDGSNNAYWTPASNASGTLNAFTAVAEDSSNAESTPAVQATVTVNAVNDIPTLTSFASVLDTTNEDTEV